MNYIQRAIEPILGNRVSTGKCLLLTGARQVGKSTMLQHLFPDYHYVSFDDRRERLQAREEPALFFMNHPAPVIIDEVQKEGDILEEIKLRVDRSDERGNYLLTGSQALELMKGTSESLAGRVSVTELCGLSLREIHGISFNRHFLPNESYITAREKERKSYPALWKTIHRGSYPELYTTQREWVDFYSSYVNTYLERDINELIASDGVTFLKFLTAAAARTGEILNYTNIASDVGVTEPTIKKWISILERTGIIYLLQPYGADVLKRAIRAPKLYFRDTGLACFLTRWLTSEALQVSAVAGNMFETFVVSEILKSFANEGMDYRFSVFYYRGKDKKAGSDNEIDLIIEENGLLYPVKIKMTGNPRASMASANIVLDKIPEKKRGTGAILCLCEEKRWLRDNLIALPVDYL